MTYLLLMACQIRGDILCSENSDVLLLLLMITNSPVIRVDVVQIFV